LLARHTPQRSFYFVTIRTNWAVARRLEKKESEVDFHVVCDGHPLFSTSDEIGKQIVSMKRRKRIRRQSEQ
jgi:hypothetical protein